MIGGVLLPALISLAPQDSAESRWSFSAEKITPRYDGDTVLYLCEAPVFRSADRELSGTWLVLWLDRAELEKNPGLFAEEAANDLEELQGEFDDLDLGAEALAPSLFARFREGSLPLQLAQEVYMEGPLVYTESGRVVGQAGAFYLDVVDGHGWIADASISVERSIRGSTTRLRVLADWVRHSADGSLRANDAIVTSCSFDDPHFHLRTGDLRITPRPERGEVVFDVELRDNSIQLSEKIAIPLPRLRYPAGSDYTPRYEGFRLGNSSRFGTFAEAEVNGDVGKLGQRVTNFLGGTATFPRGRSKLRLRWLGSRGVLLDAGARFQEDERYRLDLYAGGLPDHGDDRGIVRVDQDDRDTARIWMRSRGRFWMDEKEWVDLSFTSQTDPGVQAEFWEKDFVRYEHRDTYLHWRQARNEYYYDATALARFNSFRTEVEELPKLGLSRFSSELFRVGDVPVLYGTRTTAAYLQRVEGRESSDPLLIAPTPPQDGIEPPFDDGLGERRVQRFDTLHTLELPFSLPASGIRLTPFAETRATLWDRAVDPDDSPARVGVFAGVRAATSFWKRGSGANGRLHEVTPFVTARRALDVSENDGVPVRFDAVEDEIDGDTVEIGLRSRWLALEGLDEIDLEVRGSYQASVPGQADRWLPLGVFASLYRDVGDVPVLIWHDGRYDFDADQTVYSSTSIGVQPSENWGMELGHQRGRDALGEAVFESASIASRYRWTPKWEFEGEVSIPILDDGEDRTALTLRRFGHDFLFEIEFEDRTGEGGSSVGISYRPLIGWRQSRLGVDSR